MSYVIFDRATTLIMNAKGHNSEDQRYATERAAKGARTRAIKALANRPANDRSDTADVKDIDIAETTEFFTNIELEVERINSMTQKPYMERANTSRCCSPSSELYWTM